MATPKKKHLIELMIDAGVKWQEGAEYAAQDKDGWVSFYTHKPYREDGNVTWSSNGCCATDSMKDLDSLCRNWHQTIVTMEQYAEALALAANVSEQAVDAVEWHNPPSIEQLTADYHAKAAESDRLQAVADDALKAADDALLALEKAGGLIGLVISIDTKPKQQAEPEQPVITDCRDLRVGDVIWWGGDARIAPGECTVERVEEADYKGDCVIFLSAKEWVDVSCEEWRFIRRP